MQQLSNLTQKAADSKKKSFIGSVFDSEIKQNLIFIQAKDQGCQIFHDLNRNIRVQVITVNTRDQALQDTLDIYNWRFGTEMPIVRTYHVDVRDKSQQFVSLRIFNEHLKMRLDKLYEVPFNQMLYLMRESVIGFQRLYNKFGGFQLTPNMIAINQKDCCKVWYNQNVYSNLIRPSEISEEQFINILLAIFQQRTLKTNQGKIFFKSVYGQVTTFLDFMKYIEQFVRHYRTKVPCKFTLNCSSQLRGTFRRNSLKQKDQQRLRSHLSQGLKKSLHSSYNKHNLISSLQMDRYLNGKNINLHLSEAGLVEKPSFSNSRSNQKANKIPMVTSILNHARNTMKTSNQTNGMKVSNQTTIAQTSIDPTKLSTSNNFSIHDFNQDSRKQPHSPSQKKINTQNNIKVSQEIALTSSDIGYGRSQNTDKTGQQAFNNRFLVQKSYQFLNSPPKVIDIDQYQEPQTQIHEVTIEEEEKQYVSNSNNSNSNSNTNSHEKMDSTNAKKPKQEMIRKVSCMKQSASQEELELSKHKAGQILQKNGWRNQLGGILTCQTPMKKSVQIGKEINLLDAEHQFLYLKTPNLKVYESFIPNSDSQRFRQLFDQ